MTICMYWYFKIPQIQYHNWLLTFSLYYQSKFVFAISTLEHDRREITLQSDNDRYSISNFTRVLLLRSFFSFPSCSTTSVFNWSFVWTREPTTVQCWTCLSVDRRPVCFVWEISQPTGWRFENGWDLQRDLSRIKT